MDLEDEIEPNNLEEAYDEMMSNKAITHNLRHLCSQQGLLIKTEYANATRKEPSDLMRLR